MSFQSTNHNEHAYLFENMVCLSNNKLVYDTGWTSILKSMCNEWKLENNENKTLVIENGGIFQLDVYINIACVTPLYVKDTTQLSSHINKIIRYLNFTVKQSQSDFEIANCIGFKLFLYLDKEIDMNLFVLKKKDAEATRLKTNINSLNGVKNTFEYYLHLKYKDPDFVMENVVFSWNNLFNTTQKVTPFSFQNTSQSNNASNLFTQTPFSFQNTTSQSNTPQQTPFSFQNTISQSNNTPNLFTPQTPFSFQNTTSQSNNTPQQPFFNVFSTQQQPFTFTNK